MYLLSEGVQIAAITTTGVVLAAMIAGLFPILGKIRKGQIEQNTKTDGMKEELLKTIRALGVAEGNLQAQQQIKQEKKDEHLDAQTQIEKNRAEIEKLKEKAPALSIQTETNRIDIEKLKDNPEGTPVIIIKNLDKEK